MPIQKNLIVLANSIKQGGRCLAGLFVERQPDGKWRPGGWCRPILPDDQGHDAIPSEAVDHLKPLDVISLNLARHAPTDGQPENWVWQARTEITLVDSFNRLHNSLGPVVETPANLWLDGRAGRPDEVRPDFPVDRSLYLIQPTELELLLSIDDRRRIHAEFTYGGNRYEQIPVTDPVMSRIFANQFPLEGTARVRLRNGDNYWLTVSLGLPFGPRQCRYKFVAAIVDHSGYIQRAYR